MAKRIRIIKLIVLLLMGLIVSVMIHMNPIFATSFKRDSYWFNEMIATGSNISVGKYINTKNGKKFCQDIKYRIVSNDGETLELLSNYIIESLPYDCDGKTDYKNSLIRKFINEVYYKDFISDDEKKFLLPVYNDGKKDDYISLLSLEDLKRYNENGVDLKPGITTYVRNKNGNLYNSYFDVNYNLWARDSFYVYYADLSKYKVMHLPKPYNELPCGVCPIIKISIDKYLDYINSVTNSEITVDIESFDIDSFIDKYYKNFEPESVVKSRFRDHKKEVYLTFDDGPSSLTQMVLDILDENDIKATFFVTNYDINGKKFIKRAIESGHTIGIHCYDHTYKNIYSSVENQIVDRDKIAKMLYDDFNIKPKFLRFPGGSANSAISLFAHSVMTKLLKRNHDDGYVYFDWNISSGDGSRLVTGDEIYNNIVASINSDKENVILMHDGQGHDVTINKLNDIITYLKENDYVCLPITEDTLPIMSYTSN